MLKAKLVDNFNNYLKLLYDNSTKKYLWGSGKIADLGFLISLEKKLTILLRFQATFL